MAATNGSAICHATPTVLDTALYERVCAATLSVVSYTPSAYVTPSTSIDRVSYRPPAVTVTCFLIDSSS